MINEVVSSREPVSFSEVTSLCEPALPSEATTQGMDMSIKTDSSIRAASLWKAASSSEATTQGDNKLSWECHTRGYKLKIDLD